MLSMVSIVSQTQAFIHDMSSRFAFFEGLILRGLPVGRQWAYGTAIEHPIPLYYYGFRPF